VRKIHKILRAALAAIFILAAFRVAEKPGYPPLESRKAAPLASFLAPEMDGQEKGEDKNHVYSPKSNTCHYPHHLGHNHI
jgi:hypothetical protein